MKKLILLFVLMISFAARGQITSHETEVELTQVPQITVGLDSLLLWGSDQRIKHVEYSDMLAKISADISFSPSVKSYSATTDYTVNRTENGYHIDMTGAASQVTLDDFGVDVDDQFHFFNNTGDVVTWAFGVGDSAIQGTLPNIPDKAYAWATLKAADSWSVVVGAQSASGSYLPLNMNVQTENANYTTTAGDEGAYIIMTGGTQITLDDASLTVGFHQVVFNNTGANISLTSSETINGANNNIPDGYHATYVLTALNTWSVSTPASSGGGGSIGGSIDDNQVAVGSATSNEIEGTTGLTYDTDSLTVDGSIAIKQTTGGTLSSNGFRAYSDSDYTGHATEMQLDPRGLFFKLTGSGGYNRWLGGVKDPTGSEIYGMGIYGGSNTSIYHMWLGTSYTDTAMQVRGTKAGSLVHIGALTGTTPSGEMLKVYGTGRFTGTLDVEGNLTTDQSLIVEDQMRVGAVTTGSYTAAMFSSASATRTPIRSRVSSSDTNLSAPNSLILVNDDATDGNMVKFSMGQGTDTNTTQASVAARMNTHTGNGSADMILMTRNLAGNWVEHLTLDSEGFHQMKGSTTHTGQFTTIHANGNAGGDKGIINVGSGDGYVASFTADTDLATIVPSNSATNYNFRDGGPLADNDMMRRIDSDHRYQYAVNYMRDNEDVNVSFGTGWTNGTNKATASAATGDLESTYFTGTGTKDYIIEVTIENYTSGTLQIRSGAGSYSSNTMSADGTYRFNLTSTGNAHVWEIHPLTAFTGDVTSVRYIRHHILDETQGGNYWRKDENIDFNFGPWSIGSTGHGNLDANASYLRFENKTPTFYMYDSTTSSYGTIELDYDDNSGFSLNFHDYTSGNGNNEAQIEYFAIGDGFIVDNAESFVVQDGVVQGRYTYFVGTDPTTSNVSVASSKTGEIIYYTGSTNITVTVDKTTTGWTVGQGVAIVQAGTGQITVDVTGWTTELVQDDKTTIKTKSKGSMIQCIMYETNSVHVFGGIE